MRTYTLIAISPAGRAVMTFHDRAAAVLSGVLMSSGGAHVSVIDNSTGETFWTFGMPPLTNGNRFSPAE